MIGMNWADVCTIGLATAVIVAIAWKHESPLWYIRRWMHRLGQTQENISLNPAPLAWYRYPGLYLSQLSRCGFCQAVVVSIINYVLLLTVPSYRHAIILTVIAGVSMILTYASVHVVEYFNALEAGDAEEELEDAATETGYAQATSPSGMEGGPPPRIFPVNGLSPHDEPAPDESSNCADVAGYQSAVRSYDGPSAAEPARARANAETQALAQEHDEGCGGRSPRVTVPLSEFSVDAGGAASL